MWGDSEVCGPGDLTASVHLLTDVFQKILLHLSMEVSLLYSLMLSLIEANMTIFIPSRSSIVPTCQPLCPQFDGSHVESVLGLWLSINLELAGGKYTPSLDPTLPLTPRAVSSLLAAVVRWVGRVLHHDKLQECKTDDCSGNKY